MIFIDTADILRVIDACKNTEEEKESFRQIVLASDSNATVEDIAGNLVFAFETGESFTLNEISLNQLIFKKMRNPKNEALEAEEQETGY